MKTSLALTPRLAAAAELIREGGVLCDVGTDHAYLPIALLLSGKISAALATDVRQGPLAHAEADVAEYGLCGAVHCVLADGLSGVPLAEAGVTDIAICGMGGELIARILSESAYVRRPGVRLILQPMTAAEDLRAYLFENGFDILTERIIAERDKLYQCFSAVYDGVRRTAAPAELLLGQKNREDSLFPALLTKYIRKTEREYAGKRRGGADAEETRRLLRELYKIAKERGVPYDSTGIL